MWTFLSCSPDGSEEAATGDAYAPDSKVAAKLAVTFNGESNSPRIVLFFKKSEFKTKMVYILSLILFKEQGFRIKMSSFVQSLHACGFAA